MDTRCHPGPSLSPSTASKTPSRQADGEAAQLLTGRAAEWKDRVGEVRYYTCSHSGSQRGRDSKRQTARQKCRKGKEHRHWPPNTDTDHCPHSSDMPTPRFTHIFPIQIHHSESARHLQNRHTQITNTLYKIPSIYNSEYTYSQIPRGKSNFRVTHVYIYSAATQLLDPQIQVLRLPYPKTDRHTFNTDSQIYMS